MMSKAVSDLPRLLLCCFDVVPAPTAISRRLTEYLRGLSERYQVVVLSVKTPDRPHIERYHGARLLRVPVGTGDLAARVEVFDRAVRRQLDSEEYVLVHFFDPFGGYALAERRADFGYKLIYDACTFPSVELPLAVSETEASRRFLAKARRQELFCLMNADVVIVASELTREFVTGLGVPKEHIRLLPAPVDLGPYAPSLMGTPDNTPMQLIHLGHQGPTQDLSTLLEALQLVLESADVRLTILGAKHAEHQARLEAQVASLHLGRKVSFQPPVGHDELARVLALADVGLLTLSDVERNNRVGAPLSQLAEYLAAGRPVIAADLPAVRALAPPEAVVFYRSQDKRSLAQAILSLARDPAERIKRGAAARLASIDRDAAVIRADLVAIYAALGGASKRAPVGEEVPSEEVTELGEIITSTPPVAQPPSVTFDPDHQVTFDPDQPAVTDRMLIPVITAPDNPAEEMTRQPPPVRLPPPSITVSMPPLIVIPTETHVPAPEVEAAAEEQLVGVEDIIESGEGTDEGPSMAEDDSVTTVDSDPAPPPSSIDPWLAQLVYGYCPPESGLFERHTPPTTMPGRDT